MSYLHPLPPRTNVYHTTLTWHRQTLFLTNDPSIDKLSDSLVARNPPLTHTKVLPLS